jgi:hypothetical protein
VDLVTHPEIIQIIKEEEWTKKALNKLRLMDSLLKESQNLHPVSISITSFPSIVTYDRIRQPSNGQ